MSPRELVEARTARGWTQLHAAARLGVSQSYLSMLETGERRLTRALAGKATTLYRLPATVLELPEEAGPAVSQQNVVEELAALGYPGFSHVPSRRKRNPAAVLIKALAQKELDPRVTEALPWVLLRYTDVDWDWMVMEAKLHDLQNRLGYVTQLARRLSEVSEEYGSKAPVLARHEAVLDRSRLQREDTLCRDSMTEPERKWLRQARPPEAAHWNLLTTVTPDQLRYVA